MVVEDPHSKARSVRPRSLGYRDQTLRYLVRNPSLKGMLQPVENRFTDVKTTRSMVSGLMDKEWALEKMKDSEQDMEDDIGLYWGF